MSEEEIQNINGIINALNISVPFSPWLAKVFTAYRDYRIKCTLEA